MTDTPEKRGNRVKRILDNKIQPPEYQRLDLEPKEGGKSLLHDEFGLPKVGKAKKGDVPEMKEVSNKPIHVKAFTQEDQTSHVSSAPSQKRGLPSRAAEQTFDDDKFIPPKSNFVSVGQKEHTWYDDRVAGPSESKKSEMIDNNETVDVENLQGSDPLADFNNEKVSEVREQFEKRLQYIFEGITAQIVEVVNIDELESLKSTAFGKNSVFATLLKQFKQLPPEDRQVVGESINRVIDLLNLEFESKMYDFMSDDESEDEDYDDSDYEGSSEDEPEDEPEDDVRAGPEPRPQAARVSAALNEGQFAILVDDMLITVADDAASARNAISRLVLGNGIDIERVQLIKKISIDFGVILNDA